MHKKFYSCARSFLLLTSVFFLATVTYAKSGKEIMEEQKRRHQVAKEETTVKMELVNHSGRVKERQLSIYSLQLANDLSKGLIKFTGPADIRGVGVLTWEQGQDQDDDQWLYIPAARRVKRIASGGKKNAFMGTDLAFEDLRPENLAAHNYELVKEEALDGHDCYVIESTPATKKETKESGYGKRVFWIRKDLLVSVKTEFYNKRGTLLKIATASELVELQDGIYRANRSETQTVRAKTKTVMIIEDRTLQPDFDESFFTQQNLSRN